MAIPKFDFSVKQGNSGTIENPAGLVMTIRDDSGQPRDLTGSEIVFFANWDRQNQMRLSSAAGSVEVVATEGRVTVPFDKSTFRNVSPRKAVHYELELRSGEEQRTVLEGRIHVVESFNDD